jgi:hypothetical protein
MKYNGPFETGMIFGFSSGAGDLGSEDERISAIT